MKCSVKPLYADQIRNAYRHVDDSSEKIVRDSLERKDGSGVMENVVGFLDLRNVPDKDITVLSRG